MAWDLWSEFWFEESNEDPDLQLLKSGVMFVIFFGTLFLHSVLAVFVSLVKDVTLILPDMGFQFLGHDPSMFFFTKVFIAVQVVVFFFMLLCHCERHRIIQRFFLHLTILLSLHAVFFIGTKQPFSSEKSKCVPAVDKRPETWDEFIHAFNLIIRKAFLNILELNPFDDPGNNNNRYCYQGYLSVHAMLTSLLYFFLDKYFFDDLLGFKHSTFWAKPAIKLGNWMLTIYSCLGVVFGQVNYSTDVLLAYVTVRYVFLLYHTMTMRCLEFNPRNEEQPFEAQMTRVAAKSSIVKRFWWWKLFEFIELEE